MLPYEFLSNFRLRTLGNVSKSSKPSGYRTRCPVSLLETRFLKNSRNNLCRNRFRGFWSCLDLLDFFTFNQMFCPGLERRFSLKYCYFVNERGDYLMSTFDQVLLVVIQLVVSIFIENRIFVAWKKEIYYYYQESVAMQRHKLPSF